ncbi:hypothetical protein IIA16_02180 [bacterium]|nr:hypothetical protein [bacterium]
MAAVQILVADKVSLVEVVSFRVDDRTIRVAEDAVSALQAEISGIEDFGARQALERAHSSLRWEMVALVGLSSFSFAILSVVLVLVTGGETVSLRGGETWILPYAAGPARLDGDLRAIVCLPPAAT